MQYVPSVLYSNQSRFAPYRGPAIQCALLVFTIANWQNVISDGTGGICFVACASLFFCHEHEDSAGSEAKGLDVLTELVMAMSDRFINSSSQRRGLDGVAALMNAVAGASFLRAFLLRREWWILGEAVNCGADLVACALEAMEWESEASQNACFLVLAVVAALLLCSELSSPSSWQKRD